MKNKLQAWGITLLRFAIGGIFVAHGAQKLFQFGIAGVAGGFSQLGIPLPYASAALVTAVEFLGGIALLLGLGTRVAGALLAAVMAVATVTAHWAGGFFLPNGFEYTLTLFVANAALTLTGAGALALDNVLWQRGAATAQLAARQAA
jgi:putative oxidoreductase